MKPTLVKGCGNYVGTDRFVKRSPKMPGFTFLIQYHLLLQVFHIIFSIS